MEFLNNSYSCANEINGLPGQFQVASALQLRGCKPDLQNGALLLFETILAAACPGQMTLHLLPNIPACGLHAVVEHVLWFSFASKQD